MAASMNVDAPGSVQPNVMTVVDRNVRSPGPPVPSVRSIVMSYEVTSRSRARSAASICVRLRTPATLHNSNPYGLPRSGHDNRAGVKQVFHGRRILPAVARDTRVRYRVRRLTGQ